MNKKIIPISAKLIGIISVLLVLSLGGMTALATLFFSQEIDRSVKLSTLDRAELISRQVETELRAVEDRGMLLTSVMEGGLLLKSRSDSLGEVFYQQDETLLGAAIIEKAGTNFKTRNVSMNRSRLDKLRVQLDTDHLDQEVLGSLNEILTLAWAGGRGIRNVSVEFGVPTLAIAVPRSMLAEGEAESVALVFASLDRVADSLQTRDGSINFLVTSGGEILAHQDQALVLGRVNVRQSPVVKDSLENTLDNKQIRFTENAQAFLGSYKKFLKGELTAFSLVPEDKALAGVFKIQWQNSLISGIILCLSIMVLVFYSRSITIPIRRLVDGTNRIGRGEYSVDLPRGPGDELGQLTESFIQMGRGLAERERVKAALGRFVNKEIAERVLKEDLQLGGESRTAAIFFSDIRSFTAISEQMDPHQVVQFLNEYMSLMVGCVNQTHGLVDKFIGDAVMAVWGIPVSFGNDTENAVTGALLMRRALGEFNKNRGGPGRPVIRIGCGINTGTVVAGQIGSTEKMDYTVIGDPVNLASRIEALNKPFGTDILISQQSYDLVPGLFKTVPMKKISVKGKAAAQQIYAVLGRSDDPFCPKDLAELRRLLGISEPDQTGNGDFKEEKYEILE